MRKLAITGANGFVGRHLTQLARASGFEVFGLVRSKAAARAVILAGGHPVLVEALEADRIAPALERAEAVVHLAQIGAERAGATYDAVNVAGTEEVIAAARTAGVPQIVFFSGLGVARYGMTRHCTNRYFLSKLMAEVQLFRSGLGVCVFRPSYVMGPGGELIPGLVREMAAGEVERVGDGRYRMQPIAVKDAAALVLAAIERRAPEPRVFDLVGPEPTSYAELIGRVARLASVAPSSFRVREIGVEEAFRQARAGGYRGLLPDELDCLVCDEVADPRPLEALLGRFLSPLDEAITTVLRAPAAPAVD